MKFEVAWYRGSNCFYVVVDSKNMPRQVQENVLLHEIMHICYRNGYLSKDDDEERVVEVLTNILYPVIMSNPFKVLNDESNK